MKRSTIVRNETVSDEISFADSFYLLLSSVAEYLWWGKGRKVYIRFFGRNLWYRSRVRKCRDIVGFSLYVSIIYFT